MLKESKPSWPFWCTQSFFENPSRGIGRNGKHLQFVRPPYIWGNCTVQSLPKSSYSAKNNTCNGFRRQKDVKVLQVVFFCWVHSHVHFHWELFQAWEPYPRYHQNMKTNDHYYNPHVVLHVNNCRFLCSFYIIVLVLVFYLHSCEVTASVSVNSMIFVYVFAQRWLQDMQCVFFSAICVCVCALLVSNSKLYIQLPKCHDALWMTEH